MTTSDARPGGRQVMSWALYDWANSAFATTVLAGFFPLFFKKYWSAGSDVTVSTFQLGVANAVASLVVALMAPVLGAIADRSGARKRYLLLFAGMGVVMTGCMALVGAGQWPVAVGIYLFALIGFSGSNVFYDALLLDAAPHGRIDRVSALGFALGYLGGGVLFSFNVALTLWPETFGLADATAAVKVSFVSVAIWWALFSLPLLFYFREIPLSDQVRGWAAVRSGISQLAGTFRALRHMRVVLVFLFAYWLYIDGVHTVIRMAIDYGLAIGLEANDLIVALLLTQFVGFPIGGGFRAPGRGNRRENRDSPWPGGVRLCLHLGILHTGALGVLRPRRHHRPGAGRRAGTVPSPLRAPHPSQQVRGILRLLQHAGQNSPPSSGPSSWAW